MTEIIIDGIKTMLLKNSIMDIEKMIKLLQAESQKGRLEVEFNHVDVDVDVNKVPIEFCPYCGKSATEQIWEDDDA